MPASSSDLVLVTGASGFLGTGVTLAFLEQGYRVRGTVRSLEKGQAWEKKHSKFKGQIEWAIVPDIVTPGAFDEAIKGVTLVAHTASPFTYAIKDNEKDMLQPALEGTRQILKAAAAEKSVRRMVITSSFASVLDMNAFPAVGTTYSDNDWNPATYEEAAQSSNPGFVYCASKALAEAEAWRFIKEEKVHFSLTTLCPPMVLGPPQQVIESMKSLNMSSGAVWSVVDTKSLPDTSFPVFIDIRDISELHVRAVTMDVAAGQRYLTIADHFDNSQLADIIRKNFPEQAPRIPVAEVTAGAEHFKSDSSKAQKDFGIEWISFEKSIIDSARELFKIEAALKA